MERQAIARLLPENYRSALQEDGPLGALLAVMEMLHAPADAAIDGLDGYLSPHRAPDDFVLMQAGWLGLDRYLEWSGGRAGAGKLRFRAGMPRLRLLVAEAAALEGRRGTRETLLRFLAVATGIDGFVVAENPPDAEGRPRPFHVRVTMPAAAWPMRDLVARIVEGERPAYATYDIAVADPPEPPAAG
jgi:phage tail-like protein